VEKVDWRLLSKNPNAISILEQHVDKVYWAELCFWNTNPIPLLEDHLDKVSWYCVSRNPNAIPLLEQHIDKIEWKGCSENPNAILLLEQHPEKISWSELSKNSGIFTYNYDAIYKRIAPLKEELMSVVHHPQNILCFYALGFDDDKVFPYDSCARLKVRIPMKKET
jgi:hypothetical protein